MTSIKNNQIKITSSPSSYFYLTLKIARETKNDILYISKNSESIDKIYKNFKTASKINEFGTFKIPHQKLNPFNFYSYSKSYIPSRNSVITNFLNCNEQKILFCCIENIMVKIPPLNFITGINIANTPQISYEEVINYLSSFGYEKTECCSLPYQYSVRGSIIDISDHENAFRIEFINSKIEHIFNLDLSTQSRLSKITQQQVIIVPVTNFYHENNLVTQFLTASQSLDEAMELFVKDKIYTQSIEKHLPKYYNNQLQSLFSVIKEQSTIIFENDIEASIIDCEQKINLEHDKLPNNNLTNPSNFYLNQEQIQNIIHQHTLVQFIDPLYKIEM